MSGLEPLFHDGTGEPVLLLHGYTAIWTAWNQVPYELAKDFEVLAPTLPGHHGGPPAPDPVSVDALADWLEGELDRLGWDTVHVAGFSMGGWLAFELAKRGRARSVTAIAPAGAHGDPKAMRKTERVFRSSQRGARLIVRQVDRLVARPKLRRMALRDYIVDGRRLTPAQAAEMIRAFADTPCFEPLGESMKASRLEELDRVDVPVRVLWGEWDRVLPIAQAEFFREHLPHAEHAVLERAGHVPFWEAGDEIAAAIRATAAQGPAWAQARSAS